MRELQIILSGLYLSNKSVKDRIDKFLGSK